MISDGLMYMRIYDQEYPNIVNPELLKDSNSYDLEFAEALVGAYETSMEMERLRRIEESQKSSAEEVAALRADLASTVRVLVPKGKRHSKNKLRRRKLQADRKFDKDLQEVEVNKWGLCIPHALCRPRRCCA